MVELLTNISESDTENSWGYGERLTSKESVMNKIEELTLFLMEASMK